MKVITDMSLRDFTAWSGGLMRLEILKKSPKWLAEVEAYIEDEFPDGASDIAINDYLWFADEVQDICAKIEREACNDDAE